MITIDEYDITQNDVDKKLFAEYICPGKNNNQLFTLGDKNQIKYTNSKHLDKVYQDDLFNSN